MKFLALLSATLLTAVNARDTVRHYYSHQANGAGYPQSYPLRVRSWIGIQHGDANTHNIFSCRHTGADLNLLTLDPNCEGAGGFQLEGIMTTLWRDPQPNSRPIYRYVSGIADHTYWIKGDNGAPQLGIPCDFGHYREEGLMGYAPATLSDHPTAQQIYEYRKGCKNDGDECGGCA